MRLPHWLRCDWSKWGEPTKEAMVCLDRVTTREIRYQRDIQTRACSTCNKIQRRRLKTKDDDDI